MMKSALLALALVLAGSSIAHADPGSLTTKSTAVVILRSALTTNKNRLAKADTVKQELQDKCNVAAGGVAVGATLSEIRCEKIGSINACSAVCSVSTPVDVDPVEFRHVMGSDDDGTGD